MDPTACMNRIIEATKNGNEYEKAEAVADLCAWLASGGFAPTLHDDCAFSVPPVCTAAWDARAWCRWWLSDGAKVASVPQPV